MTQTSDHDSFVQTKENGVENVIDIRSLFS